MFKPVAKNVTVKGKFLFLGEEKFFIKGVTYGTFAPREDETQFPSTEVIEKDFAQMASKGINCVRTYTVPPTSLFEAAEKYNLKVMVGLPWEQHITFLDDEKRATDIVNRITDEVKKCNAHHSILCYTIGNEIPAGIVRWYGAKKIEKFLHRLYMAVKAADPVALVTYVNYPTTEYLNLDFLDFTCFNVYLETPAKLSNYIARLQNLSEEKPLVLAEIGLDSRRNGLDKQAEVLGWQIKTVFSSGCAGMFVFAWTDEWWRGGFEIEDWDFGLVTRNRDFKPALDAVTINFKDIPIPAEKEKPLISVVVCTYNGSATIRECLTEIRKLDYPNYEVIVINDGSTDGLEEIVKQFPVRLITTTNNGLSHARNTGMFQARGEIIAYIDDDAFPDKHWLNYLAYAFTHSKHGCIGGPNIAPSNDGFIATAVANAPGGPVHVLVSDEIAEHVPGCNMAFRRDVLLRIGGFDPVFTNAGDDVDVCWRIQHSGYTIGFHPSAMVWHRRRNSLKAYWKQQKGYGKAEALLEYKWPEKYNRFGHLAWGGRIYGNGLTLPLKAKKDKVFHGVWGTALFQSVYEPATGFLNALPLMPEWYLFTALCGVLGLLGFIWTPLLLCWALFAISLGLVIWQGVRSAKRTTQPYVRQNGSSKLKAMIVFLHVIQPMARLYGRLKNGLTPWRLRGAGFSAAHLFSFGTKVFTHWSETWHSSEEWLTRIEKSLLRLRTRVKRGGEFDDWDLQSATGLFTKHRSVLVIEEHGAGKQYLRLRTRIQFSAFAIIPTILLIPAFVLSLLSGIWIVSALTGIFFLAFLFQLLLEKSSTLHSIELSFLRLKRAVSVHVDQPLVTENGEELPLSEKISVR